LIPPTKKTLFQDPVVRPSDNISQCSNTSSNDSAIVYKASCSGAVDQYSNLLLKNENKRLEKENKKLTNRVLQMEAELKHSKENRQQKREENGKLTSVVKKEPLEDTKGIDLDFSIPKVSASVPQQTSFRAPKSSKKELPTDNINSEDQCATQ
ncbi:uncharacterized protein LOC134256781, partial [Saccostrea cucullata]|uniref:uncharacterized protein LOC134256781 n=1 Tax=Saccostrea cuccullata TaxID=36930 RepID=UPI002ED00CD4